MKLKCIPEDFIVEEMTRRTSSDGPFCLYELQKRSIGTPDALSIVRRNWNLAAQQLSHGGLKDRHAQTKQFISIRNGPHSDLDHELFQLRYLGQTRQAYGAADIQGNRFALTLRSMTHQETQRLQARIPAVSQNGFPNYFDSQRFGSLGVSKEFVAAAWCLKNYERATWLAMAEHNSHDDAAEREQKQILRDNWGDWNNCKQQLSRSHRRSIVTYLVDHPDGFRKAFALINSDLRGLFLSAFQSAVWNRMLASILPIAESATELIGDADLPFPSRTTDIANMPESLPQPSGRLKSVTAEIRKLCDAALQPYGMTLPEMKLSFPRDRWFSRGLRSTFIVPNNLIVDVDDDDMYRGKKKAILSFDLPRGCYATMLVKTLSITVDQLPDAM